METVKMPTAVQAKAGTASRAGQTAFPDQSQGFVKLLQEKKDTAQPDRTQTKTDSKKPDSVLNKDDKASQAAEAEKEPKDKVPEDGKESQGRDDAVEEALLQAGLWQTAAQITGMLAEDTPQEGAGETVLIPEDSQVAGITPEAAAGSQLQEALTAREDSALIQTEGGEAGAWTEAAQAAQEVLPEHLTEESAGAAAEVKAADIPRAAEAGSSPDTEGAEAVPETEQPQRRAPEAPRQDEARNQNASSHEEKGQETGGLWQSTAEDTAADSPGTAEADTAARARTGVSQVREDRKTEQAAQEPAYRTDSEREQSWQPFAGEKTGEIPLRTSESRLPQDLGKTLAAKLPGNGRELVIELEPAALGKLTIKLAYEGGRAAVSILASNPRTLELLNQRASEIAAILEEKTGQDTIIYTHAPQQQSQGEEEQQSRGGGRQDQGQEQQRHHENQHQTESFAQQLRLGLI